MLEITKKKFFWIVVGLMVAGLSVRLWNFSPWLHFELDQARDALLVGEALENGPGELPLLGPKAAGTFLRLGPAFYYIQYLSGLIFGNSPQGVAFLIPIISAAGVGLVYLLSKRLFDQKMSAALAALFAFSAFLVLYARFAWNPNLIPVFVLGAFYALLRAVDQHEAHRGRWLVLASVMAAIATQLHFLIFLILPASMALFLTIRRPHVRWRAWAGALAVFALIYSPVIMNDLKTGGASVKEFTKAVTEKSDKGESHTLGEKAIRAYTEATVGSFLLVTGQERAELFAVDIGGGSFVDIRCDQSCRDNLWLGTVALAFFSFGLVLMLVRFAHERERRSKDAILLVGIWTVFVLVLFIPLSYSLSPRFFLLLMPTAFVMVGLLTEFSSRLLKHRMAVMAVIFGALIAMNGYVLYGRFSALASAEDLPIENNFDRILKERTKVTLEQQLKIADKLESAYLDNGHPVYINSEPHYRRALLYHLKKRGVPYDDFRNASVWRQGNYFVVYVNNDSFDDKVGKYLTSYTEDGRTDYGTLKLAELSPRPEAITGEAQDRSDTDKPKKPAPGVPIRYTWNEIFEGGGVAEDQDEEAAD